MYFKWKYPVSQTCTCHIKTVPTKSKSSFSIAISTVKFTAGYVWNHAFQIRVKIKFTKAHGETREIKIMQDINISMWYCQLTDVRTVSYSEITAFLFLLYAFIQ